MDTKEITIRKTEILSLDYILPVVAFSLPLFISGPQILTGTLVNSFLFLVAGRNLSKKYVWTVAMLPSMGAFTHGVLFGPFTLFLLYFLPFIWVGNMLLITSFSSLRRIFESPISIFTSSLFKSVFLYTSAFVLVNLRIVPKIFLTTMGMIQFLTAILGGILALSISRFIKSRHG